MHRLYDGSQLAYPGGATWMAAIQIAAGDRNATAHLGMRRQDGLDIHTCTEARTETQPVIAKDVFLALGAQLKRSQASMA
jgi:hypothetical protein